jgi:tetratricopeptide (TPR) repeat protein
MSGTVREEGDDGIIAGETATLTASSAVRERPNPGADSEQTAVRPHFDHVVPDTWSLTIGLAVQAARDGKLAEAEAILGGVVQRGPPLAAASASFNLGQLLLQRGEADAGLEALRRAVAAGDQEIAPMAQARVGLALNERGDLEGAAAAYEAAIAADAGEHSALSALRLAALRGNQGNLDAAEAAFVRAAQSPDPEIRGSAQLGQAMVLADRGQREAARRLLQQVIDTAPVNVAELARQQLRMSPLA